MHNQGEMFARSGHEDVSLSKTVRLPDTMFSTLNHPLRESLARELHARPFLQISGAASLTHLAIYSEANDAVHRRLLEQLCGEMDLEAPAPNCIHCSALIGDWQVKWERHTAFSTFTFVQTGNGTERFFGAAIQIVPAAWLSDLGSRYLRNRRKQDFRNDVLFTMKTR